MVSQQSKKSRATLTCVRNEIDKHLMKDIRKHKNSKQFCE